MSLTRRWDESQSLSRGRGREGCNDVVDGDAVLDDVALRAEELRKEREGQILGVAPGLLTVVAEVLPDRLHVPPGVLLEEVDEFGDGREDF